MAAESTESKTSVATLAQPSVSSSLPLASSSMFMTMPIESISSLRSLEVSQSSLDEASSAQQRQQALEKSKLTDKDNAAAFGLQLLRRQSSSGWKSLADADNILEGDGPSSDRQLFGLTSLSQLNSEYSGFGASNIPSTSSVVDGGGGGKRWSTGLSRQSSIATQNTDSSDASPGIKVLLQKEEKQPPQEGGTKKKKLSMEDIIRRQFQLELPPSTPPPKTTTTTKANVSRGSSGGFAKITPATATASSLSSAKNKKTSSSFASAFPPPRAKMSRATSSTSEYKPSSSSSSETSTSTGTKRKRGASATTTVLASAASSKKLKTGKVSPPPKAPEGDSPVPAAATPAKPASGDREWVSENEMSENDVLCCKGGKSNHWPGNKRYRRLIAERRPAYHATENKSTKTSMSNSLVDYVHAYGGRFLKGRKSQEGFFIMSKKEARRKVAQNLRESKDFKWL